MAKETSRRKAGRRAFEANIMDGLADPVILLDENRHVVDANFATRELLGENAIGLDLSTSLDSPLVIEAVDAVLNGEASRRDTVDIPFPIARTYQFSVWELSSRTPGKALWAMLVLHDITATRKAEKMRVDFISNVSHELRSPLSSLISFIETLQGPARDDQPARERFLTIMSTEARRMSNLIDDLLTLSKVETDEHIQPRGDIDLCQIIEHITAVLSLRAKSCGMTFNIDCPSGLTKVNGDGEELTQVFQNLIDNAIKYGRDGTTVQVTLEQTGKISDSGHELVSVAIHNQGEGIAAKHISRLTERFYRADKGRSRSMGGTGLGLAIAKHIISRHRGHMDIESAPGEGSTFTVYLPVAGNY